MNPGNRIHHQIGAKLSRIVHQNIQPCLKPRSDQQRGFMKYFFQCRLNNIIDRRHYGRDDTARNLFGSYMIKFKQCTKFHHIL